MSLPYFRKWVDDWLASPRVGTMTLEQLGAFDKMLCRSWQLGPLPNDRLKLAKLLSIHPKTFDRIWITPLKDCWQSTDEGLINERLEEERVWAKSKIDKAVKAARHRWGGHADAMRTHGDTDADASPKQCHPDPDPDPDKKKNTDLSAARKAPEESVAMVPSEVEKALWLNGALVINEVWLREKMEQFYNEVDKAGDPRASKLKLTAEMYRKGKERLAHELVIHQERRAVGCVHHLQDEAKKAFTCKECGIHNSSSPKKRGFATYVSRHFFRIVMDHRCRRFPGYESHASKVDSGVASLLEEARILRERERESKQEPKKLMK